MNDQKRQAIQYHYAALVKGMDAIAVMDNLSGSLLSQPEREFVKESSQIRRERNRELISILFRTREELEPFEGFVDALKNTEKHEIMAAEILKTYTQDNSPAEVEKVSETSPTHAGEIEHDLQTKQPELSTMNA
uniref:CARD domain-containing protein n=1 Tax=Plectus sambesii TaxID=2011161 RepID=A0A914XEG5_9BILA